MTKERSNTTMLTAGGHGPARTHGKERSKEVAKHFFSKFKSNNPDMRWGWLDEDVPHVDEKYGNWLMPVEILN